MRTVGNCGSCERSGVVRRSKSNVATFSYLSEELVLVYCDKFLLRIAFDGFFFPRNTDITLRIFFFFWFRCKFSMSKGVIFY